jgi:hypothetical protein
VPTVEERLATLEAIVRHNRRELSEVLELIHSGPRVPWDQSIRGRLHKVSESLASVDKLAEAAREVRRAQVRAWSRAEKVALLLCATATAVAPYVALILTH